MALFLRCPYSNNSFSDRTAMDVSEAHSRLRHRVCALPLRTPPSLSSFLTSVRFLSPYICHNIPLGNVLRFAICIGNSGSSRRCTVMSIGRDKSTGSSKGMRKVVWTIETELEPGQLLYVTGDPTGLGCWEPEMAILMSPTEHINVWKAEVKVASGVSFKYNYFIKEEISPYDVIWRPGPPLLLSVPYTVKRAKNLVVRDSWVRSPAKASPGQSLMSWIEDAYLNLIQDKDIDEDEAEDQLRSDLMESMLTSDPVIVKDELRSENDTAIISSEPFSGIFLSERYQLVEEPWLVQPSISSSVSEDMIVPVVSKVNDTTQDDEETKLEEGENLSLENSMALENSISTLILINSSICTMQRIALLENGQLVELLLEPVKTKVQCDSVYVGVVSKLVPHMGGAFVNIGRPRPSLMDIKQNREPFIFPPFQQITTKSEVDGALVDVIEEHLATLGINHTTVDSEMTQRVVSRVELEHSHHDDDEDNDTEEEPDVPDIFTGNMNGNIVDHGEVDADCEGNIEGRGQTTASSIHSDVKTSAFSHMPSLQDLQGSGQVGNGKNKWARVQKGTKIIVQVVKEGLGTKGPTLTAYPKLRSRFWVLITRCDRIGVSKKITGVERTRLKVIAKTLQPRGFGLTVRTVAAGHTLEELQKDLESLLSTWKTITEQAKFASLAADEGVEGAVPVILHEAMGQTLSVVQDYFNEKVERMIVDSARTYHEVTNYLEDMAPDLCDRVELHKKRVPLFDEFNIEEEIDHILSKRVPLPNGGSLVIEQTEALVSIDVNGGHVMFGHGNSQAKAILDVNLAAAKQIARELRLRDIGGIIVVDFIDMTDESNKRLVYEEVKNAVAQDRSLVKVSELSKHGIMEITRKRVRPSVTFMISEPCPCCHATGRVEALETSFSKIEQEISRLLATMYPKAVPQNPKLWPKFVLRVDHHMSEYLTSGRRTRLALLSSSLKVWILLKVAREFTRGAFEVKPFVENKESENKRHLTIPALRSTESKNTHNSGKNVTLIPIKKWKTGKK